MRRFEAVVLCAAAAAALVSCHNDPGWRTAVEIETELERKYSREFTLLSETVWKDDKTVWTFADNDGIKCRVVGITEQNIAVDLMYYYHDDYTSSCLWADFDRNFAALAAEGTEFSRNEDTGTINIEVPDRKQYHELLDADIEMNMGLSTSYIEHYGIASVLCDGDYLGQLDKLKEQRSSEHETQSGQATAPD